MAKLPRIESPTAEALYKYYETKNDQDNWQWPTMRVSSIGNPCKRALWFAFRWAHQTMFPGRTLKLFETGRLEEERIINIFRGMGLEVWNLDQKTGYQFRFSAISGHLSGSIDGVIRGLIEAPKTLHLLEVKTHNQKNFDDVKAKGVRSSKPEHFAQMQTYLGLMNLEKKKVDRFCYVAANKNTDEIYIERGEYDKEKAEELLSKAKEVIFAESAPEKAGTTPDAWGCKFCSWVPICHGSAPEKLIMSCRTCIHSTAEPDGTWSCAEHAKRLTLDEQRAGCGSHLYHPDVINLGEPLEADRDGVTYQTIAGEKLKNLAGGRFVK